MCKPVEVGVNVAVAVLLVGVSVLMATCTPVIVVILSCGRLFVVEPVTVAVTSFPVAAGLNVSTKIPVAPMHWPGPIPQPPAGETVVERRIVSPGGGGGGGGTVPGQVPARQIGTHRSAKLTRVRVLNLERFDMS